MQFATFSIPGLPGVTKIISAELSAASLFAMACSTPLDPIIKTLM